jgi:hypothetical protein
VEGDLDELYMYWYRRNGKSQATFRYVLNVLSVLPHFVRHRPETTTYPQPTFFLHLYMLRNFFKIAFRNFVKNKAYSFINIGGLKQRSGIINANNRRFFEDYRLDWKGRDLNQPVDFDVVACTHDFGKTVGWQITAGRDFSQSLRSE